MTSDRKTISSRNNSRKGRGPRTAAGKARSSQNAFRHGLSVSVLKEPAMCAQVEKLARALAGLDCDDFHLGHARIIAEAQIDLARIQDAKVRLLNAQFEATMPPADAASDTMSRNGASDAMLCQPIETIPSLKLLKQLARLERYELRTTWRRRRAMCAFFSQA
jgi:hypothetical protein